MTPNRFARWVSKRVLIDKRVLGGEPVFEGTRLAVCRVGEMLSAGATDQEILDEYPYLTVEDLDGARIFLQLWFKSRI